MSLLQDVLRPPTDILEKRLANVSLNRHANSQADDSEDEFINVVSANGGPQSHIRADDGLSKVSPIGTPTRSNAPTRPSSPTSDGFPLRSTPARSPLHATSPQSGDPLKALPTELSQHIFRYLSITDLAKCALVSRKWNRSQTLNYGASTSPRLILAVFGLTHRAQCGSSGIVASISTMAGCLRVSGQGGSQNRTG